MRVRSELISCVAVACFAACTSTSTAAPTITKPATECPAGVWFATFTITQNCPTGCPLPWHRLSKKINGQWEVQYTGCGAPPTQTLDLYLEPGEYMFEGVCYGDADENNPPESGWEVCAYLISWRAAIEVRREGSTGDWGGSATVAAGGKDPPVHKADIQVTADPPVANLAVEVLIPDGYGEGSTLTACPAALIPDPATLTTGSDGVATATFTSSNKIENVPLKLKPVGVDHEFDSATVCQRWDDDEGLEFQVPDIFVPGVGDTCKFTCRLAPDAPIAGHSIQWYTTAIKLDWYEWNMDTGEDDGREDDYEDPFDSLPFDLNIGEFVAYTDGSEGPDGVYSKTHTINDYFDIVTIEGEDVWQEALVMTYGFAVYDDEVYE